MSKYNVTTSEIEPDILYINVGEQDVTYNSILYSTGQYFTGIRGISTFSYSGSGTQIVNEVTEFKCSNIEFVEDGTDRPVFDWDGSLNSASIEFSANPDEISVNETSVLMQADLEYTGNPTLLFSIKDTIPTIKSIPPTGNMPTALAIFGDSMTDTGFLAYNYPAKLAAAYPGLTIRNYGISGNRVCTNTYAPVPGNHNLIDQYSTEIGLGYTGQLVSFAFGENDSVQGLVNSSWKTTYKNIIQAFISSGFPLNRLLIIAEPSHSTLASARQQVRTYISEIASELGIMVYSVYQRFLETGVNDTYYSGLDSYIHPLEPGQIVWASGYDTFLRR